MIDEAAIAERYRLLSSKEVLNERGRRLWAAAEARSHGFGGISAVARATGLHENTIRRGVRELESDETLGEGRVRRPGAGNKPISETHPKIEEELERLVAPETRGDPESPLRWTSKSAAKLARALAGRGYAVSDRTVLRLLKRMGYSLQANRKTSEGADHPDRDAQFKHINDTVERAIERGQPAISVDTKKRELVGDFKAVGRELEPKGKPVEVRTHDFKDKDLGHAIPYGIYDLQNDEGWVNVGIDRDTAQFAAASIRGWWESLGKQRFPDAKELTITADAGGSNSYRTRLWKVELQKLADATGLSDHRLPLPARHEQVEQDRASPVQLHLDQLARQAADQPRGHHQPDHRHDDQHRTEGLRPTRRPTLPKGNRSHRRGTRRREHHPQPIPRRLELHHHSLNY